MQSRKPILPPSRSVLVSLPLSLIDVLDDAANTLCLARTDVIRRCLMRDAFSLLREEVARTKQRKEQQVQASPWSWGKR